MNQTADRAYPAPSTLTAKDTVTVVHANKVPLVRSMMATIQQITFFFNYSAQRLHIFQAELQLEENGQAGVNNITNLQSLCQIR